MFMSFAREIRKYKISGLAPPKKMPTYPENWQITHPTSFFPVLPTQATPSGLHSPSNPQFPQPSTHLFEGELEHSLKQSLKQHYIIQVRGMNIYNFQLNSPMYPYYFPYENSYYMPQYTPYYSDINQIFQCYSLNQEIKMEDVASKNEEVNTNYSINGSKPPLEEKALPIGQQQPSPRFLDDKCDQKDNDRLVHKRSTKSHSPKTGKVEIKVQVPKFRYTHKNFESNIINKIFSFLWSEDKSRSFVNKILKDRTKSALYFDYIKIIRKYCKRYINKEYLLNLCDYKLEHIAYRIVMKQTEKLRYFSLEEFSMTVRKLIFIYLDTVCATSILTSKKMRTDIWKEHFEKMRNIRDFLFGRITGEEYDMRMSCSYGEIYPQQQQ